MNLNTKGKAENTYDAIVVGSGISGGWSSKELTERGLKVLMLDRGHMINHVTDYTTANLEKWELPNRNRMTEEELVDYYVQRRTGYTITPAQKHFWQKDTDHPYTEKKPFDWIRGYHVGGRSLSWGRQSYRLSEMDFEANAKDGIAVDWPVRYADVKPWYDKVESFIGVSGQNLGLSQLPDGVFLPPMEMNAVEKMIKERIAKNFDGRVMTIGRAAHLTKAHNGRGKCQFRNRCMRGCPYGGYFSTQASTLPAARATGNLTLRPNSIVTEVVYDDETQKATSVRVLDAETNTTHEFFAKVIFLNASALASAQILLQSTSERFPNGLGNDSDQVGRNVMDHHFKVGASGDVEGFEDRYYRGKRPNGIYVPRFRNLDKSSRMKEFIRGYGYQGGASRSGYGHHVAEAQFGAEYKDATSRPGKWRFGMTGFGECLPYEDNRITLNYEKTDMYGQPTLVLDVDYKANEKAMRKDMASAAAEMLEASGLRNVREYDNPCNPGNGIHEMGTARMGRDPKTSVLNEWNQIHAVKNVFITDGAMMTSSACQNPSLTYMAFSARAANYAADQLSKNEL